MRYDEYGVVIPAPLQGSDTALAGKRYGDKHRGPAVSDAYELSRCWIDLADRSERWPFPADTPARIVELAQAIPEGQRTNWLRRQVNLDEVSQRISYAIRSGDLPVWVAPQGEPERLVATGALATIDKRSIAGGVFCPQSEEYKSEAERPWLWERPLFIKRDDWVQFAASLDAEKTTMGQETKEHDHAVNLQPVAPPYHGGANQHKQLEGIAVPDAIRLNDAVVDLTNHIRSGPPLSETEVALELKFYSSENDQMREYQIREVAMYYIREAIQSGRLILYTMLVNGAHPIDHYALRELTFRTLRSGTYQPTKRLGDPFADTALWILNPDWEGFRKETLVRRSGGNGGGKVPPNRQLDYEKIRERVTIMRKQQPDLTIGSAAASIVAELPPNPKTGKPRDQRGIEKIIAPLWEGKAEQSPD